MAGHSPCPGKDNHPHPMDQVLPQFCLHGHEVLAGVPSIIVPPHDGPAPNIGHTPNRYIAFIEVAQELECQDARPAHDKILSDIECLTHELKLTSEQMAELVDIILKIKS